MNVLITGVAGSGKTTQATELTRRGYNAINMDSVSGLCAWVDLSTGQPAENLIRETAADWVGKYDWNWNGDKLAEILDQTDNTYFCGSAGNQQDFYKLFDKLFLLKMDEQLIRERLVSSTRDHDYGSRPGEVEAILGYYEELQNSAIKAGAVVIDAKEPVKKIAKNILLHTLRTA